MRDQWYTTPPPPEREHYLITDDSGEVQIAYIKGYIKTLLEFIELQEREV